MSPGFPDAKAPMAGSGTEAPAVSSPDRSLFLERHPKMHSAPRGESERGPTYPAGFRAAGVTAGIKESGRPDVALLAVDPAHWGTATGAAVYTRNAFPAAPVELCRADTDAARLVAVGMNSGNANACTGAPGLEVAHAGRDAVADALGTEPVRVAVASTGIIGEQLDAGRLTAGFQEAAAGLSATAGASFAKAILTTDRFPKVVAYDVETSRGPVRIGGCAKGAGMIAPSMATMLAILTTDAVLEPQDAAALLGGAADAGFNRVTVDGEMSTNDCVFLLASGAGGVRVDADALEDLRAAIEYAALRLALMMVADGEGAVRVGRVRVKGLPTRDEAMTAARAVGNSPLVKTALFGGDPNWGRIIGAVGGAFPDRRFPDATLDIGGVRLVEKATAGRPDARAARELRETMAGPEIDIRIDLAAGEEGAELYFSDLGYEYVRINAEYHT